MIIRELQNTIDQVSFTWIGINGGGGYNPEGGFGAYTKKRWDKRPVGSSPYFVKIDIGCRKGRALALARFL